LYYLPDIGVLHKIPTRIGNKHPNISPFSTFKCKDDQIVICGATDKLFHIACDVMGLTQLKIDSKCKSNKDRLKNNTYIQTEFEKALAAETVSSWYDKFVKTGVPAGPINDIGQALNLPTVNERQMVVQAGKYSLPGYPIKMSSYKESGKRNLAPAVDQDGARVRKEFRD